LTEAECRPEAAPTAVLVGKGATVCFLLR